MSASVPYSLDIGQTEPYKFNVNVEYTSGEASAEYKTQMDLILKVFNKDTSTDPVFHTETRAMFFAIQQLLKLAQEGFETEVEGLETLVDPNNPTSALPTRTKTSYFTQQMAESIKLLVESLLPKVKELYGNDFNFLTFDDDDLTFAIDDLRNYLQFEWRVDSSVRDILNFAVRSVESNRTLQAMIELDYVRTGNQIINDQLGDLEGALGTTKEVLNTLRELQEFHNEFEPIARDPRDLSAIQRITHEVGTTTPSVPLIGLESAVDPGYDTAGSQYWGEPINIGFVGEVFDDVNVETSNSRFISFQNKIQAHLDSLAAVGITPADETSIAAKLQEVLDQMNAVLDEVGPNMSDVTAAWVIDKQNDVDSSQAGKIQQNITFAIQTAETLNDEQKEQVRRFMFVFEEYYKSAAALLNKINQIIERMAQNIGR